MKKQYFQIFILLFGLFSFPVKALEYGCSLNAKNINEVGTKIVRDLKEKKEALPENIPLQFDFDSEFTNKSIKMNGTMEGFFRPAEDDFYSIIPIPFIGFDISRDRVVIYACIHIDEDPSKTHLTLYFMRGYHIDPLSWSNFVGDLVNQPELKIRAVPASLIGISEFKKFLFRIFRYIPFSNLPFDALGVIQRTIANTLGDLTGFGVERIEVTTDFIRISSGVNLDNPSEVLFKKTFSIEQPESETGADSIELIEVPDAKNKILKNK